MKKSELPFLVPDVPLPTAKDGWTWQVQSSGGKRFYAPAVATDAALASLGIDKVRKLVNRALGIEVKEDVRPLIKAGKDAEAQSAAFAFDPLAVRTRTRKPVEVSIKADKKGNVSAEQLMAALSAAGIKVNVQ